MSDATKRFHLMGGADGMGNRYAGGPLCFLSTDCLKEAQRACYKRGHGEVFDIQANQTWSPGAGWSPLEPDDSPVRSYREAIGAD